MDLTRKKCVPCEGGIPPMTPDEVKTYLAQVKGWESIGDKRIRKKFSFKDFKEAMVFVNNVADLAEYEGHHPDIHVHWNEVTLELWTHKIGGLHENDFILAAKVDILIHPESTTQRGG